MGKTDKEAAVAANNLLDVHKIALVAAFNQVSLAMRECATQAEQFAQSIGNLPASGNVNPQTLQLITAAMSAMPHSSFPAMAQAMLRMPTQDPGASPEGATKGKRARGKKAKRDPNKPKRPASAYLMYQNVVRKEFAAKYPGLPYHEVLAKISEQWQNLTDEEKEPYREATRIAKLKYDGLKATYDAGLAANGQNPPSSSPPAIVASPSAKTIKTPLPVAILAAATAAESSEEEDGISSEDEEEDEDEDEEEEQPAPKKQKTAALVVPIQTLASPEKKGKEKEKESAKEREKEKSKEEKKKSKKT